MNRMERFYSPPEIGAPGREKGKRLRRDLMITGLFTVVMLTTLVVFVRILSDYSGKTRLLETECAVSGGIQAGTPVMQDDYLIGKVTDIQPTTNGDRVSPPFQIRMRIDSRWDIPSDYRFLIGSAGLLQGSVVKLVPGAATSPPMNEKEVSAGYKPQCEMEGSLVSELNEIMSSVKTQIKALEGILIGSDESVGDDQQKTTASMLRDLSETISLFKAQMEAIRPDKIEKIVDSAQSTADNVDKLTRILTSRSKEIEKSVDQFSNLAEQLNTLVSDNKPRVDRSLTDTHYILQELANSMTPILNNLDETSRNLREISEDFRTRPVPTLFRSTPGSAGEDP